MRFPPNIRGYLSKPFGGTGGDGFTVITTTTDFDTTNGVAPGDPIIPASGPSLEFTPEDNSVYAIIANVIVVLSAAGVAPQLGVIWPTALSGAGSASILNTNLTTAFSRNNRNQGVNFSSIVATMPSVGNGYMAQLRANLVTGVVASNFQMSLKSENGIDVVTCAAGSWMAYRKMN